MTYSYFEILPETIRFSPDMNQLSYRTFATAEINQLIEAIPTQTQIGRATLAKDIVDGVDSSSITMRQEAIEELADNSELSEQAKSALSSFAPSEMLLYRFIDADYTPVASSRYFASAKHAMTAISDVATLATSDSVSAPENPLLKDIFTDVAGIDDSRFAQFLKQPFYQTTRGLKTNSEASIEPRVKFKVGPFTGRAAAANLAIFAGNKLADPAIVQTFGIMAMTLGLYGGYFLFTSKPIRNAAIYRKISDNFNESTEAQDGLLAIGRLDELLALGGLKTAISDNGYPTCFPEVSESPTHFLHARDLRNPVLAHASKDVVGNDVSVGTTTDSKLTFLTGPNSGGKSTLSKALIFNQLLGQVGGPVTAQNARMSIADRIAYHVPTPPDLEEMSGRFGHELKLVREILDETNDKSLVILDDCLDGTTHEERVKVLKSVLLGFINLSGTTVFSTHAHELVSAFKDAGVGSFVQVEFVDNKPSHRIIPGISTNSHADRVAREHQFGEDQMQLRVQMKKDKPIWF